MTAEESRDGAQQTTAAMAPNNPFHDDEVTPAPRPVGVDEDGRDGRIEERRSGGEDAPGSILPVGRNATLTLGTEALVVLDEGLLQKREYSNCCGLLPSKPKTTRAIPFHDVLWATLADFEITIHYAHTSSKNIVRPGYINYNIEKTDRMHAQSWMERLLERAYGASQRRKRIKVLINPYGGTGAAQSLYTQYIEPIFAAAQCEIDVERTNYSGHAVEIAKELDLHRWDVVACCSGDGLPYEVFNGLAARSDALRALKRIAVVQLPCGSGNAMCHNLNGTGSPSLAALAVVKGLRTPMDLVSVTQGDKRYLSFLSQSVGIVAESDLGTEHLRWMGAARFTYGFLVRLLRKQAYPCDIAVGVEIDNKQEIRQTYQRERSRTTSSLPSEPQQQQQQPSTSLDSADGAEANEGLPPLRYGTINDPLPEKWTLTPYPHLGNFYAGNMAYMAADSNFFQASLPSDGCMDLITISASIPRLAAIKSLLAVENGTFFDQQYVNYRKISGYRIVPRGDKGYVSVDGERVPFRPFQAEVHRGLGTVLSKSGRWYETKPL